MTYSDPIKVKLAAAEKAAGEKLAKEIAEAKAIYDNATYQAYGRYDDAIDAAYNEAREASRPEYQR